MFGTQLDLTGNMEENSSLGLNCWMNSALQLATYFAYSKFLKTGVYLLHVVNWVLIPRGFSHLIPTGALSVWGPECGGRSVGTAFALQSLCLPYSSNSSSQTPTG